MITRICIVSIICLLLLPDMGFGQRTKRPNIVIIVADDMGWNDVSFHGSNQIPTPNLDALAYNGVILNRHYVPPLCTPSRASLMTGKYPIHTGMQHFVVVSDEPWGLGLHEKIMPQFFRDAGYKTHLVGKWHLGFFEREYTPTERGFDEHIGYLGPYIDYWNHSLIMLDRNYSRGHDMRRNLTVDRESSGVYATNHFSAATEQVIASHDQSKPLFLVVNHLAPHTANENDPMQAPEEEIRKFSYIKNEKRRTLAAMISLLDKSVGRLVASLKQKNMLDNTVILFYSDNGAPTFGMHSNQGSNLPFKGQKDTPFEGGTRVPAFIWSPLLKSQRVSNQLIHNADWLPTLAEAARIKIKNMNLDGISQWNSLVNNLPGGRRDVLVNIDEYTGYSSYMNDGWKLVNETQMPEIHENKTLRIITRGNEWLGAIDNDHVLNDEDYVKVVLGSEAGTIIWTDYPNKSPNWFGPSNDSSHTILGLREEATVRCLQSLAKIECDPMVAPCLFNVFKDPCEHVNLAEILPFRVKKLQYQLERLRKGMLKTRRQPSDEACDPKYHNFTWTWWMNNSDDARQSRASNNMYELNFIEDLDPEMSEVDIKSRFLNQTVTVKSLIIVVGIVLLVCVAVKMAMVYKSSKVKIFEVAK